MNKALRQSKAKYTKLLRRYGSGLEITLQLLDFNHKMYSRMVRRYGTEVKWELGETLSGGKATRYPIYFKNKRRNPNTGMSRVTFNEGELFPKTQEK